MKTTGRKTFCAKTEKKGWKWTKKRAVLCAAAAALVLMAGVGVLRGFRQSEKGAARQEAVMQIRSQLHEEMEEAAGYLEKLDERVARSQEKLEEVNGQLKNRQETLLEVETVQKKLTENTADVSVRVTEMEKQAAVQIADLQGEMSSLREEILRVLRAMDESLQAMDPGGSAAVRDQEAFFEKLDGLSGDMQKIGRAAEALQTDLDRAQTDLRGLIGALEERGIGDNEALLTALSEAEAELKNAQETGVSRLSDALEAAGQSVNGNLGLLQAAMDGDFQELETAVDENFAAMQASADEQFQAIQTTAGENFNALRASADESFNGLHTAVDGGFGGIQTAMDGGFGDVRTAMDGGFGDVRTAMDGGFGDVQTAMDGGFDSVQTAMDSGFGGVQTAMSGSFDRLQAAMEQGLSEQRSASEAQTGALKTGMEERFAALNQAVEEKAAALDGGIAALGQRVSQDLELRFAESGNSAAELKSCILQLQETLGQELDQVFTSVSNGKRMLASALLTKGVAEAENASFSEIMDAILRIPQKIVIGQEELPGQVSFQYHYHVDGNGENPHTEMQDAPGGCYTRPLTHVHSREAGCYGTEAYHEHSGDCPGHPAQADPETEGGDAEEWVYDCDGEPNASRTVLICGREEGAAEGYGVSCALADGQVIGAVYSYDTAAVREEQSAADGPAQDGT